MYIGGGWELSHTVCTVCVVPSGDHMLLIAILLIRKDTHTLYYSYTIYAGPWTIQGNRQDHVNLSRVAD